MFVRKWYIYCLLTAPHQQKYKYINIFCIFKRKKLFHSFPILPLGDLLLVLPHGRSVEQTTTEVRDKEKV